MKDEMSTQELSVSFRWPNLDVITRNNDKKHSKYNENSKPKKLNKCLVQET